MKKLLTIALMLISAHAFGRVDRIDLSNYVTDFSAKTDQTAQVQAAEAAAFAQNLPLYHPGGTILTGYIKFREPVFGISPSPFTQSVFKSTVNDGTPAFETTVLAMENVSFLGNITNHVNAIGLKAGDSILAKPVSRSYLTNVKIAGFTTGFTGYGWVNRISGLSIIYCDLGAIFDTYNGALIDAVLEQNYQDIIVQHSNGIHFSRLLIEGTVGDKPSTVDSSTSVSFDGFYAEQKNRTVPWIVVGGTSLVKGFYVPMGDIQGCGAGCNSIQIVNATGVNIVIPRIF